MGREELGRFVEGSMGRGGLGRFVEGSIGGSIAPRFVSGTELDRGGRDRPGFPTSGCQTGRDQFVAGSLDRTHRRRLVEAYLRVDRPGCYTRA